MTNAQFGILLAVLAAIFLCLADIDARLRKRFSTREEQDLNWPFRYPIGHWELYKNKNPRRKENPTAKSFQLARMETATENEKTEV
jgi:hypothetical protein